MEEDAFYLFAGEFFLPLAVRSIASPVPVLRILEAVRNEVPSEVVLFRRSALEMNV
jgi:hypothetical protein